MIPGPLQDNFPIVHDINVIKEEEVIIQPHAPYIYNKGVANKEQGT